MSADRARASKGAPVAPQDGRAAEAAEFDAFSDTYDRLVNEAISFSGLKVDFFARVKANYLLDLMAAHFADTKALSLLDIGCGVGNYHPLLIDRVGSITGVDVSKASLAEASRRNPAMRYDAYDGSVLPYADGSFDVAFTICVMHHVDPAQWSNFASEMRRVIRPGGLAVVFEHNPRNPLTRRIVTDCTFDENAVLLPAAKTRELLTGAGFRSIEIRHILAIPAANRLLRYIDLLFGRLPLGAQYFAKAIRG